MANSGIADVNFRTITYRQYVVNAVASNGYLITVPAGSFVDMIMFQETAGKAVTGGINIGTSALASNVVSAQAVGANAASHIPDSSLSIRVFAVNTPIYISAASAWNGASLNVTFIVASSN